LRPAVEAYLGGGLMTPAQIAAMRAYLRQWIASDWASGEYLDDLRDRVRLLYDRRAISEWLSDAVDQGIDPL
jgi:hypothetical protein